MINGPGKKNRQNSRAMYSNIIINAEYTQAEFPLLVAHFRANGSHYPHAKQLSILNHLTAEAMPVGTELWVGAGHQQQSQQPHLIL